MKQLRKIFAGLRLITNTPSSVIRCAMQNVMLAASGDARYAPICEADSKIITAILEAVISLAEDDEKPTKPEKTEAAS